MTDKIALGIIIAWVVLVTSLLVASYMSTPTEARTPSTVLSSPVATPSVFSPIERVAVSVSEPPPVAWDRDNIQVMCLGLNIYHEARGSSLEDKISTALVVMNRVKSDQFPDTPCEVIWQNAQFSWTQDGRSDIPHEGQAYEQAMMIGYYVWMDRYPDLTYGATHYHTTEVSPAWTHYGYHRINIGAHVYMKVRNR